MHQENTNNQSRCYNINIKEIQLKVKRIKGEQRNSFILMKRAIKMSSFSRVIRTRFIGEYKLADSSQPSSSTMSSIRGPHDTIHLTFFPVYLLLIGDTFCTSRCASSSLGIFFLNSTFWNITYFSFLLLHNKWPQI